MIDCITITDGGSNYHVTIPGEMLRESGLLVEREPNAPLPETELIEEDLKVFVEFDPEERTLTYHLPDEPEDRPTPETPSKPLTRGERAVLSEVDD